MPVSFSDLQLAFEFVSSGGMGENEAYLDRQSGKIYWHSEFGDNDEELPTEAFLKPSPRTAKWSATPPSTWILTPSPLIDGIGDAVQSTTRTTNLDTQGTATTIIGPIDGRTAHGCDPVERPLTSCQTVQP